MAKLNLDFYSGEDLYSDGIIEDELLQIVKTKSKDEIFELVSSDNRWPILYHLSPIRGSILLPCDIHDNDECLEVGSGCGAITESLCMYSKHVTCVDLSKRRCEINFERNKHVNDLTIYAANFNDMKFEKKYDKIFLIGVLEYAKLYFPNEKNPFIYFLNKLKSLLKNNGELFIAIENKYGMKYFSGSAEDHTAVYFNSIEGYDNNHVETFSKKQLISMFNEVGFNYYFYYPLPDYKMPIEIFSQDYFPSVGQISNLGHSFDRDRYVLFNETKAMNEAIKSNEFEEFVNSFLIKLK